MLSIAVPDDVYQWIQSETARQHQSVAEWFNEFMSARRTVSVKSQPSPETVSEPLEPLELTNRQQWLERLRQARSSLGAQIFSGSSALTTQEILNESRADRC
jgi:hypothetical protein